MSDAISCPECMRNATRVIDSRPSYDRGSICRRRECCSCGCRWTTYEVDADRLALLEENIRPANEEGGRVPHGTRPPRGRC